jgi:NAD(P)-dependent dehydrogenase (short-subunit alcohol dehydrogenase family)
MPGRLNGKVAIVTGAGSGIGRASASTFAREGASVACADVQVDGGEETARLIEAAGGKALFLRTDVSRAAEVEALVRRTVETFGRLDCAHNNAGIEGAVGRTADYDEEQWARVLAVNLTGVWLCMKYELQAMAAHGGAIVNTASVAGLVGIPGMPAYCASKGGVVQLTRTAALEYARRGIRINCVCPGTIRTPMVERLQAPRADEAALMRTTPLRRMGEPEEIAESVVWLCSDAASFVTGQALGVDGGYTAQ